MKLTRYTKFTGDLSSSFGLDDLMQALSDFLLDSGYQDPFSPFANFDDSMDSLREAIQQALESGDLLDEEAQEQFDSLPPDQVDELIDKIIQRMKDENFLNAEDPTGPCRRRLRVTHNSDARFEVTDKGMDFLGYKALRDLLGPLGKSSLGRHDTRHEAAGVETNGSSKQYEFGDSLNLDITATLNSVFAREGAPDGSGILNLEYSDLHVQQADYQSSCATVVLLDCSHSMILYGEDRFTPAKRVAMALAHLIRTQYPRRLPPPRPLPRFRRRDPHLAAPPRQSRPALHQHPRRPPRRPAHPQALRQRHEADRHDHRRQTLRAHPRKTAASTKTPSASTPSSSPKPSKRSAAANAPAS